MREKRKLRELTKAWLFLCDKKLFQNGGYQAGSHTCQFLGETHPQTCSSEFL